MHKRLKTFFLIMVTFQPVLAKKQVFLIDLDTDDVTVKISEKGLTRLCFEGDRIQSVMGMSDDMILEKDDTSGHLFVRDLKAKEFLTIYTENGTIQDVTLMPDKKDPGSVVFKVKKEDLFDGDSETLMTPLKQIADKKNPDQEVISLIRCIFLGQGLDEGRGDLKETSYGLKPKYMRSLTKGSLRVDLYEVTNTSGTTQNLMEKDFYKSGDVAVAVGCAQLTEGQVTHVAVVSKGVMDV